MAIVCDFFGIYLRKDLIQDRFAGGMSRFRRVCRPALEDEHLVCFTFMNPSEVNNLLEELSEHGFRCAPNQPDSDVAIVAQPLGPIIKYTWLESGKVAGFNISGCWLKGAEPGHIVCPEYMRPPTSEDNDEFEPESPDTDGNA